MSRGRTKWGLLVAGVAAAALTFGCASGPKRLSRSWDDHVNQKYSENAWVHGALLQDLLPVYPLVGVVAGIGDVFVNFYWFWTQDAWDNRGTAFEHKQPTNTQRKVSGSGL